MVQELGEAGLDDRLNKCDRWYGRFRCCKLTTGGHGRSALLKLAAVRAASNTRFKRIVDAEA